MPLKPGGGRKTFLENLAELSGSNATPRPMKQRLAIAYAEQERTKGKKTAPKRGKRK